jgi:hypothetical protein
MNEIKDYIKTVTRAFTKSKKSLQGGRGACIICYNDAGDIREINISSSLITRLYHKGNKRDICPQKFYVSVITKQFPIKQTDAMLRGCYLETMLLGEGADGHKVIDLPRHKISGAKLAQQKAIDAQVGMWEMRKENHGIIVNSEGLSKNIQVRQKVKWPCKEYPGIDVWIYATADLISPFKDNGIDYEMSVIDIKGTADVNSTFGEYGWGEPKYLDHFQMVLYNRVYELPVLYLVFDWSKNLGYKAIPVNVNINHPDQEKANEAKYRIREMEETVRKTIIDLVSYEKEGWKTNPGIECDKCPNIYCEHFNKIHET